MKKFKESRTSPRQIYRTVNGLKNDLQHESAEDLKVLVDQTLFQFGLKYDGDIYRKLNTGDEYPYHVWKALPTQNLTQRWLIGIWPGFDGYDYQFRIYAADTLDQIKNNEVEPLAEYEGTNSIDELISDLEDAFKYFINEDFKEFQKYPQEEWDQMVKEGRVDENGNLRNETFEPIVDENDPVCGQFHIFSRGGFDAYMSSLGHPLDESEKMRGEKMRFLMNEAQEGVSGLKWYQRGDTFKQNWGDNFIDAKAVDAELDAIIAANGGNEFQVEDPKIKEPLSFKIKGWYNFNGDNVEVELIFNREFEDGFDKEKWGTMHGDMASCESHYVEDWLNEHLADFGFEDYEIISSGWDRDVHVPTKGIHWYKYSMKNKDNTHKMPNLDDWSTGNSNLNGTEPFTKEEGKEIDKEVANYIAELMKANPKGVYGRDVTATPEDMEDLILKVRPTGVTWRGSYTHNYGYFAFEIDVRDYYDSERENWRGQKGTTWGASEDDITSLLKREAADALNDFLYEFNLEIVPDNCKAEWYHGSREDVTYLEFDVYFKEIGIDPYKSYKAHSGNSFKDYWDGSEPKDLYKGKTFKRNPKRIKEGHLDHIKDRWQSELDKGVEPKTLMDPWAVCEGMKWLGKDGWIRVEEVLTPTEYEEPYPDFYMEIFDQHTCVISHDIYTINEINSYVRNTKARLVNNGIKNLVKESKNLNERVLDYDTWDKYYDEGAEAYFEGKTLSEVPITGNAWFREAWEEGWKSAKACDDEDAERAEAAYEEEAY